MLSTTSLCFLISIYTQALSKASTKQSLLRMQHLVRQRLKYNNPFKGIARTIAPLDYIHFVRGGNEELQRIFSVVPSKKGTKWIFNKITYEAWTEEFGMDQLTKCEDGKGALWIDPMALIYCTQQQTLLLQFVFCGDEQQAWRRSFPKIAPPKGTRRSKRFTNRYSDK